MWLNGNCLVLTKVWGHVKLEELTGPNDRSRRCSTEDVTVSTSHYMGLGISSLRGCVDDGFRDTYSYLAVCKADSYVVGNQEWSTGQNVDVQVVNNQSIQDQVVFATEESKVYFSPITVRRGGGVTPSAWRACWALK